MATATLRMARPRTMRVTFDGALAPGVTPKDIRERWRPRPRHDRLSTSPAGRGIAAPLIRANIDTDAIIPSREIKGVGKTGLADGLFAGWRYTEGRNPDSGFLLNDPHYAHAPILLAGDNFGCGSSREHAVWALHDYGVRAVIAPGFAPIFAGNCLRNGIVPVVLAAATIATLGDRVTVDLLAQTVTSGTVTASFAIDPEAKGYARRRIRRDRPDDEECRRHRRLSRHRPGGATVDLPGAHSVTTILLSEVGLRDGLQSIDRVMPLAAKKAWIAA